jgi:hypothetical protein
MQPTQQGEEIDIGILTDEYQQEPTTHMSNSLAKNKTKRIKIENKEVN